MNKTIAITLTAAATMLCSSPRAWAGEPTYPGMMCKGGSFASTDSNGHVENNSSLIATAVTCPIVDDPTVESPHNPTIFVTDAHASLNVCCSSRLKIVSQSVYFGSSACTSGFSSGYKYLNPTDPINFYDSTWAHRFFLCTMPPTYVGNRSEIRTYRY